MPLISTSTTLKDRSCEVKISTLHNKKLQASVCHIEFDTSETSLLGLLLSRYAREKCVECGVNTASQIYSCIPGKNGIVIVCPENKLTQNITLLYAYLQKTKLSSAQAKFCSDGNYKKLIFAMADVVISRAGANAICELLALKKPNLLIPLPASSSRGDQLLNAASFEAQGFSIVMQEENLTPDLLVEKVQELYFTRQIYIDAMSASLQMSSIRSIMELIEGEVN